ncbi:MAG: STAS domain-containing protein [Gammaproteobacteria bacterium]|nr:STAS domain-containing protein [Gammaproteobacteria bacterium]
MQNSHVELQVDQAEEAALVINVIGRIDGVNAQEFYNNLSRKIDGSDSPVILDLEKLTYISSAGLRSILLIAKTLKGRNTRFMLCSLPDPIKEIVEIAGFDKIIDVLTSRSEAIAEITG